MHPQVLAHVHMKDLLHAPSGLGTCAWQEPCRQPLAVAQQGTANSAALQVSSHLMWSACMSAGVGAWACQVQVHEHARCGCMGMPGAWACQVRVHGHARCMGMPEPTPPVGTCPLLFQCQPNFPPLACFSTPCLLWPPTCVSDTPASTSLVICVPAPGASSNSLILRSEPAHARACIHICACERIPGLVRTHAY